MCQVKTLRVVRLESATERLVWSFRMARWNRTFPKSYKDFEWDEPSREFFSMVTDTWEFLEPFFSSRGYTLYYKTRTEGMVPRTSPKPAKQTAYPFSRVVSKDKATSVSCGSMAVWPARDQHGRDVIIKAISDVSQPSDELKIMLRLNEKRLRSDPFNHTICALEFLTFDQLVFVVMPRWDKAFWADFSIASELMEITKSYLEVFVFLHKHRIVHHDFFDQNTGMNVVANADDLMGHKGLRNPGEVQYVLFDFGNSIMYPEDSVIDDLIATRPLNYGIRDAPPVEGPYNPFKADIALLGLGLQLHVRHIENVVPELGPFFDSLINTLDHAQLSAPQALSRFMEIYSSLSPGQLQEPVQTWLWQNGKSMKKTPKKPET